MEESKYVRRGAFLIESISPREILIPEDFTEEQRLIAQYDTTITTIREVHYGNRQTFGKRFKWSSKDPYWIRRMGNDD